MNEQTQLQLVRWWQRPQPVWVSTLLSTILLLTIFGLWNITQASFASEAGVANSTTATASTLSYQGFVTNSSGTPLDGNQNFIFRLFGSSSGGTALWTETHNSVPVSEGLFNVVLGSKTSGGIPDTVWQNPVYLETVVNGQALVPREAIQLGTALKSLTLPTVMQAGRATVTATEATPELALTITFDPPFPSPPKLFLTPYYNYTNRVIAVPGDPCTGTHCTIFFRWVDGGNWEPGWFQSLDWLAIAE